jgi:hypothetical protein
MHPAVPPMEETVSEGTDEGRKRRTSCYDDIYLVNIVGKLIVDTHGEIILRIEEPLRGCSMSRDRTIAE